MDDRFLQEMSELQQHASQLQAIFSQMRNSLPEEAVGRDERGTIQVRVGTTGLPRRIAATAGWQLRCRPDALGTAVSEAYSDATARLMKAWSERLPPHAWQEQAATRSPGADPASGAAASKIDVQELERPSRPATARPLDELVEDVLSRCDDVDRLDASGPEEARATGTDRARRVSVSLSPGGFTSCEVDARWADGKTTSRLNRAFGEALAEALSALARVDGTAEGEDLKGQLDALFGEALHRLENPPGPTNP